MAAVTQLLCPHPLKHGSGHHFRTLPPEAENITSTAPVRDWDLQSSEPCEIPPRRLPGFHPVLSRRNGDGIVNLTLAAQKSLLQVGGIYHVQGVSSPGVGCKAPHASPESDVQWERLE